MFAMKSFHHLRKTKTNLTSSRNYSSGSERKIIHQETSKFNGNITVSEKLINGDKFRLLTFETPNSPRYEIQGRVKIREDSTLDHSGRSNYVNTMISTSLCLHDALKRLYEIPKPNEPQPIGIMSVGLGVGSIPQFYHSNYPNANLEVVEIDPNIVQVAKDHFGFSQVTESDKMKIFVGDIKEKFQSVPKESLEIIYVDIYNDKGIAMEAIDHDLIGNIANGLKFGGVLVLNVFGQLKTFNRVTELLKVKFRSIHIFPVETTRNSIIIAHTKMEEEEILIPSEEILKSTESVMKQGKFDFDFSKILKNAVMYRGVVS